MSVDILPYLSNNIISLKGQTNKTKCIALTNIRKNDILFTYTKSSIITSEGCKYPDKYNLIKNITKLTKDEFTQNKLLLSFCIFNVFQNPNNTDIPERLKLNILQLPIENVKFSEKLFNFSDLNEFKLTGKYDPTESEFIDNLINMIFNINDKEDDNFIFFYKIYYYVNYNSFNFNNQSIILPFINVCNIIPFYLNKPNLNYINTTYLDTDGNYFYLKTKKNFYQNEQFVFSYDNILLDNDKLMLKQGIFLHDNIYDFYIIDKKLSFKNKKELNELLKELTNNKINKKIFKYMLDNDEKDLLLKFKLLPEKINEDIFNFGVVYFNWRNKNNDKNIINKQAFGLILRMCYDKLIEITSKFEKSLGEYLYVIQEDKNISDVNRYLKNFTVEKLHLIQKNIKFAYKELVGLTYSQITNKKQFYIKLASK